MGNRFFFGGFPLNGESCRKEKLCRKSCGSIMSIFEKKFFNVLRFCALMMTLLILGELGKPKIVAFVLSFSLNVMSKFRIPEMKFRGSSDTDKK